MEILTVLILFSLVFYLAVLIKRNAYYSIKKMKIALGIIMLLAVMTTSGAGLLLFSLASPETLAVEQTESDASAATVQESAGSKYYAAAIAIAGATLSAAIAVAITGSAAIGGITQNPGIFGRSLVFVGLAEGIAIYGLIISFMILTG